jgi:PAS domain S-box-containing protein
MKHPPTPGRWPSVLLCALGGGVVALVTFVCFRVQVGSTIPALLYLLAVVLVALRGGFAASAVVSVVAVACLQYFFLPPLFSLAVAEVEAVAALVFLATALTITRLMTARRRAEMTLRGQAALLDVTHDIIFVRGLRDDVITYWNRAAEEAYGWTKGEAVGAVPHQLLKTVFPEPIEEIMAVVTRAGRWEGEIVHTRSDGTSVVVASRWSLQRDEQGRPAAILETNNDLTERKRAEKAWRESEAELAHVTRVTTMGELAASLAHELNQSLTGIVTNASASLRWLGREPPNLDEATDAVRRIIRDAKRASDVIAHTRALLKKSGAEKKPVDLTELIREVLALVQPELSRHRIVLRPLLADGLPPVLGARVQLQQVALNLIMNGIEAMAEVSDRRRELVVRTERHALDAGLCVLVAVQDTGTGIAPESRDRLFEPFYTTKSHGLGMGLSISRSIIQAHGGRLSITPNPGHGVTSEFVLPARSEPAA